MDFQHNFNSIPIIRTNYHSSVKVRVLLPWGGMGDRGGHTHAQLWCHFWLTCVTSIDSPSQFLWSFVWNEWDYKLHNHSFHTKDQRNWDGLSIDVAPVNWKWHHSCACMCPPCPPPWHRTLTFTLLANNNNQWTTCKISAPLPRRPVQWI